jgi:hypothetical protein
LTAVVVLACAAAAPAGARAAADQPDTTSLLPPGIDSAYRLPLGFEVCPEGSLGCPRAAVAEMYRRWRPLNNRCDHKAVFALTYLRTTEEFLRTLEADPRFFSDGRWVNWEDRVFAQLYFNPADAWRQRASVPGAWRVAFEASESPDVTGVGDLLLGMNAHIQRDLAFTLAHVGLVRPDGQSRKADHDKVNQFLDRVATKLQQELASRYDQVFVATSGAGPVDEPAALQGVRTWREIAWRNAERLVNARSDDERAQVARSIDDYAESQARSILAANTVPGYGPTRDAYCRAHNRVEYEPNLGAHGRRYRLRLRIYHDSIRRLLRTGRMRTKVTIEGAATVKLTATAPTAKSGQRRRRRVALLATASVRFPAGGSRRLALRLTHSGRAILASTARHRRRLRITVTARALRDDGAALRRLATQTFRA